MKRILILTIAIALCAGAVSGQVGYIQLTLDPLSVDCVYFDLNSRAVQIYAIHRLTPGVTSSRWMVQPGATFTCIFLGEFIEISAYSGSTQTGLRVMYTGCQASDIHVATIEYFCLGNSPDCAYLQVVPDPAAASGEIEVVDCQEIVHFVPSSAIIMNDSQGTCGQCSPSPVQGTTWGNVKSLYRD